MGLLSNSFVVIANRLRNNFREGRWLGNYPTWQKALENCASYDAPDILEKVKTATLKVKNGEAAYERDSILFNYIEYSWPLLASLMYVAAQNKGSLKVLDFGGSLGSSYFQNKLFLAGMEVEWDVVEQSNFVEAGRKFIQDDTLQFFHSIDERIKHKGIPDILITSCTLPYIEQPYTVIREFTRYQIPYILIDNTPFNYKEANRICIQKIPAYIYKTSGLPCWLLSYSEVKTMIAEQYQILTEHQNESFLYVDGRKNYYRGFLARHKSHNQNRITAQ